MKKKVNSFKTKKLKSGIKKPIQNNTKFKIDELRTRLEVIKLIEHKAALAFEELISKNFSEINVRRRYVYDKNKNPILIKEDEDYLSIKDMFIWEIMNHFRKNKLIAESKRESRSISEGVRNAKVISDLTEFTDAMIDEVILGYTDVANLVLSLTPSITPEGRARISFLKKKYEDDLYNMQMKNRIYDIRLFERAKEIYKSNKGKRPRITYSDALFLANEQLKIITESLRDEYGNDTQYFISMQNAFRKKINDL